MIIKARFSVSKGCLTKLVHECKQHSKEIKVQGLFTSFALVPNLPRLEQVMQMKELKLNAFPFDSQPQRNKGRKRTNKAYCLFSVCCDIG